MNTYNIVEIDPSGHKKLYIELILVICSCLKDMGCNVTYNQEIQQQSINLIFGFHKLLLKQNVRNFRPNDNCFIFNLLPLNAPIFWMNVYVKMLADFKVIDYSQKNLDTLLRLNPRLIGHHFKFGYYKTSPYNAFDKNESNLFFGLVTEHRKDYLNQIASLNIPLKILGNAWGYQRDMEIAMAKNIINIEKYPGGILEAYRLWHSLCLGTSVLSTKGSDPELTEYFEPYVSFFESPNELLSIEKKDPMKFNRETSINFSIENLIKFTSFYK